MKLLFTISILLSTLIFQIVYSDDTPPNFTSLNSALNSVSDAVFALDLAILVTPLNLLNALTVNGEAKNLTYKLTDGVILLESFEKTSTKISDSDGQNVLQTLSQIERRVNKTVTDLVKIKDQLQNLQIIFIAQDDVQSIANVTEIFIIDLVNNVMPDSTLQEAKKLARRVNHSLFVANLNFGLLPNQTSSTAAGGGSSSSSKMKQYSFLKSLFI